MKFAFCFLTYQNIIHTTEWTPYFQTNNIYIHPKERDSIHEEYRRFVIPKIINTSWGNRSIVDATILLLEQAFLDTENKWFILCSEDSFPVKPYPEFAAFFETQKKSILNIMDESSNKTSQWWALSRADVEILLKNKSKHASVFDSISRKYKKQAVDELFFLNALKQFDSGYTFTPGCVHYVKWFSEWISKHPTTFNRLLEEDIEYMNTHSCWFIRKTFPTFQNQLVEKKSTCIVMCIGSESIGNYSAFLNYFTGKANLFLLVMDPTKIVDQPELKAKCEQVFYVVWNMADKAMEVLYNKFAFTYKNVFLLQEKFNYTGIEYPPKQTKTFEFLKGNEHVYMPAIIENVASVTPTSVTPTSVTPASLTPASLTPSSQKIRSSHKNICMSLKYAGVIGGGYKTNNKNKTKTKTKTKKLIKRISHKH